MYCVNGKLPYFKTVQEARAHALKISDQWLGENRMNGLYRALADIYDDKGVRVGSIVCAPDIFEAVHPKNGIGFGFYYMKEGTTEIQFMNACDGSLAPETARADLDPAKNRYRVPYEGGELPFTDLDEARAFLYKIFSTPQAVIDSGSPIVDADGKTLGMVLKRDTDTVIFGNGRKWKVVRPNGKLGKAVNARYGDVCGITRTKVAWEHPLIIGEGSKDANGLQD